MNTTLDLIRFLLSSGWTCPIVYDIGSNQGHWTAEWEKVLPDSIFYMFEANTYGDPDKYKKHKLFNVLLSDVVGKEVNFYSNNSTGDSYYQENTGHFENVKPVVRTTDTIDNIIETFDHLEFPQFVKIDTQGSELDILRGAPKMMQSSEVIHMELPILCYNKNAPKFSDYIDFMTDHEFFPIALDEVHRSEGYIVQQDFCFIRKDIKNLCWPNYRSGIKI